MKRYLLTTATVLAMVARAGAARADMAAAEKWVDSEFQPSTLTRDEQLAEMEWFIKAAEPFQGMEINVLSETIPTHTYESQTLTEAFEDNVTYTYEVTNTGTVDLFDVTVVDDNGTPVEPVRAWAPTGSRRMGSNPHANGGLLLRDLDSLPWGR